MADSKSDSTLRKIRSIVGDSGYSDRPVDLTVYAQDMWPRRTIMRAAGRIGDEPPVAVVWPDTVQKLADVVKTLSSARVPFLPVAAGSGVCGGGIPPSGAVVIDLKRLNRLVEVDAVSMTAVVEAGMNGMHLEEALVERGYTLGHFPSSIMCSTAGGWAACRSAGQYSSKFGKIEDMIVSMDVVLPDGRLVTVDACSRHSACPDLSQLIIGSEGTLAIIVRLTLRVAPAPATRRFSAFRFSKMESGLDAMRQIMQAGVDPTMMRLYDPLDSLLNSFSGKKKHETAATAGHEEPSKALSFMLKRMGLPETHDFGHALTGPLLGKLLAHPALVFNVMDKLPLPSLMVMGFEGSERETRAALVRANELAQRVGGKALGPEPGEHWYKKRYSVSWKLAKVFNQGAFAETIEVAGLWKDVAGIYHAVHSTLMNRVAIMAHFSHAYHEGCAVYFSLAGSAPGNRASLELYDWAVNTAIERAINAGATVSHHHGAGLMKSAFLDREWSGGRPVFDSVRNAFDPDRVLNPGKLFEASPGYPQSVSGDVRGSSRPISAGASEVVPESAADVGAVLADASASGVRLTRQGGGGAEPGRIRLNLSRIDQIVGMDVVSHTVTVQAGLPMHLLENYLQEKGFTLGFVPRRMMGLDVGAYLATVSPSAGSPRYGTVRQNCVAVEAYLPDGTKFSMKPVPRRAAGPDLRYCFVTAGGVNGVITSATFRIFRIPAFREAVAFGSSDPVAAVSAVRSILLRGVKPEWALVVTRAPADIGSRRSSRLAIQLAGERDSVNSDLEIVRDVMGPLGLVSEPVTPDSRLAPPQDLFECREVFLQTGPLMDAMSALCQPSARRGPDAPEIHVTHFSTFGATLRVLLREPGQKVPDELERIILSRTSPELLEIGRQVSAKLDPAGVFGAEVKANG